MAAPKKPVKPAPKPAFGKNLAAAFKKGGPMAKPMKKCK